MTVLTPEIITGLPGGSKAFYLAALFSERKTSIIVVTAEDVEAEGLAADLEAWTALTPSEARPAVIFLSELDEAMRIAALGQWSREKKAILLCSKAALEKPVYSPQQLKSRTFELRPGASTSY